MCTYFGPGTEYLVNGNVDRRRLARMLGIGAEGFRERCPGALYRTSPGDVLYLKGDAYAGNQGAGQDSCR